MIERAKKGLPLGKRPIGYGIGPEGYEIIPEEAQIVKKIFNMYVSENIGLRGIADELNKLGIKSRNNNLWSHTTIRDILENEVYVGTFIWGDIRVEDRHPPIIDRATFEKVQSRRFTKLRLGGRAQNSTFLLSGLLRCAKCNEATMVGRTARKGKYVYKYYRCNNYASKGTSACLSHEYRANELERLVLEDIENLLKEGPAVLTTKPTVLSNIDNLHAEMKMYEQELQNLDRAMARAAAAYEAGAYDLDFFNERKTSIIIQKGEIKKILRTCARGSPETSHNKKLCGGPGKSCRPPRDF
ncbi:MAG: recombinase family protein [Firmicutes bacterium]|nr:recombinase family protein [Bacillota bacterium]